MTATGRCCCRHRSPSLPKPAAPLCFGGSFAFTGLTTSAEWHARVIGVNVSAVDEQSRTPPSARMWSNSTWLLLAITPSYAILSASVVTKGSRPTHSFFSVNGILLFISLGAVLGRRTIFLG